MLINRPKPKRCLASLRRPDTFPPRSAFGTVLLTLVAIAGCATHPQPTTPALQAPPPPATSPAPAASAPALDPLYRPPRIARIYLRAHQDASGRLVGPQVIYQVVDPGGWNIAALDHTTAEADPERKLVPTATFEPNATWFLTPPQSFQPTASK